MNRPPSKSGRSVAEYEAEARLLTQKLADDFREFAATGATSNAARELGVAMTRLLDAAVLVTRLSRKTGEYEVLPEVRLTFRRRSGQWYAGLGKQGRTGTTPAEAMRSLADALIDSEAEKRGL